MSVKEIAVELLGFKARAYRFLFAEGSNIGGLGGEMLGAAVMTFIRCLVRY